jgi:hypothetical protein
MSATAVVAMGVVVHIPCEDENEVVMLAYQRLYQSRMAALCLRSARGISLHLINPDDNDPLLMDILFAHRCAVHGISLPKAFSVESLRARDVEQHRLDS